MFDNPDLLIAIYNFLPPADIATVDRVCKLFNRTSHDKKFCSYWKIQAKHHFGFDIPADNTMQTKKRFQTLSLFKKALVLKAKGNDGTAAEIFQQTYDLLTVFDRQNEVWPHTLLASIFLSGYGTNVDLEKAASYINEAIKTYEQQQTYKYTGRYINQLVYTFLTQFLPFELDGKNKAAYQKAHPQLKIAHEKNVENWLRHSNIKLYINHSDYQPDQEQSLILPASKLSIA